jgi:hypothetical protein
MSKASDLLYMLNEDSDDITKHPSYRKYFDYHDKIINFNYARPDGSKLYDYKKQRQNHKEKLVKKFGADKVKEYGLD